MLERLPSPLAEVRIARSPARSPGGASCGSRSTSSPTASEARRARGWAVRAFVGHIDVWFLWRLEAGVNYFEFDAGAVDVDVVSIEEFVKFSVSTL